jgi:hypothetical protein
MLQGDVFFLEHSAHIHCTTVITHAIMHDWCTISAHLNGGRKYMHQPAILTLHKFDQKELEKDGLSSDWTASEHT